MRSALMGHTLQRVLPEELLYKMGRPKQLNLRNGTVMLLVLPKSRSQVVCSCQFSALSPVPQSVSQKIMPLDRGKLAGRESDRKPATRLTHGFVIASVFLALVAVVGNASAFATVAGTPGDNPLAIVSRGTSSTVIVSSPQAGPWEKNAIADLQKYIGQMTGVTLQIAATEESNTAALANGQPLLIVGEAARKVKPELYERLQSILKTKPFFRADGILLQREGERVYLLGSNDESHYFAVAELLRAWGVRWFMPGEFGECVPEESELAVGDFDLVYAPPFEVRTFLITWLGDRTGASEFQLRNMMIETSSTAIAGHALGGYTKGLEKSSFEVPLTDPKTAEQVASKAEVLYAKGKTFSLAMEDGLYASAYPRDKELMALQWDKYVLRWSVTDPMLELLNGVASRLRERHPESAAKIGFLIYSNMFLPPTRDTMLEPSLYGLIAPIDIDPIHPIGYPNSPSKAEFGVILDAWAKLLPGRLLVYDYDQSMLVWRDLPNPSHLAFATDVKRYRDAGVAGFTTETRLALATTGINLYLRGRLMWNPDENVDALLDDFYVRFFGPAEKPMRAYWRSIFDAWQHTIVTEHEYFLAPAIYTPPLIEKLAACLQQAEKATEDLRQSRHALSPNERLYLDRIKFMQLGFQMLKSYMAMSAAAASKADYAGAVAAGEDGLRWREALKQINPAFATTRLEKGTAFWPGEVQQYRELVELVDGTKGRLLMTLPLEWALHRDKSMTGMVRGFLNRPIDLSVWRAHGGELTLEMRKDYPDSWEMIRTDLYVQAQGVRDPDGQSFTGDLWYRTEFRLSPEQIVQNPHIRFPGIFNACELYMNGREAARRELAEPWWLADYRFEWDVSIASFARAGVNALTLRCHVLNHWGGIFRRPFLYAPVEARTQ